jgi:transposase InsO family protein
MQTELLDRQRWRTRIGLLNAIFEYIEGFYNRRRRRSTLPHRVRKHHPSVEPGLLTDESVKRGNIN